MSYKVWNTALDPTRDTLRRRASKMQMEPIVAGKRLRLRGVMELSDELFEHNKANLELYKGWGVLDFVKVGEEAAQKVEPPAPLNFPTEVIPSPTDTTPPVAVDALPIPVTAPEYIAGAVVPEVHPVEGVATQPAPVAEIPPVETVVPPPPVEHYSTEAHKSHAKTPHHPAQGSHKKK